MSSFQTVNNASVEALTPATEPVSAWEKLGSFVDKIGSQAVSIYTADRANKLSEKQLDLQAGIEKSRMASSNLNYQLGNSQPMVSNQTKKVLIIAGIALVSVVALALVIRAVKK